LKRAKQPSDFCSSKYFFSELSVVTLLGEQAAKRKTAMMNKRKRIE
jgi:hypothetical protein